MDSDFLADKAQFFDRWAPSYDFLLPSVVYQAIHQRLLDYVQLSDSPQVLDIGCGTGRLLQRLADQFPHLQGTGLDLSSDMLKQAQAKNPYPQRLSYVQGSSTDLPFKDNQFDAAFSTISFLHYPTPDQVLREVSRVLQPHGRFHLVDYIPQWTSESIQKVSLLAGGMTFYAPEAREQLGTQAGLGCLGHYHLLGPVVLTIFEKPASS